MNAANGGQGREHPGAAPPFLTMQVVLWNSARVIDACLASLALQTDPGFELVAIDNASSDGCGASVEAALVGGLQGRLIRAEQNLGFCGGQNLAFSEAHGSWILFLNPDTILPADFVARLRTVTAASDPDVGTIAPLILLPDGRVDSSGLFLDRLRRVFDRDQGRPPRPDLSPEDVFGCTGAAAIHRRAMLVDVAEDGCVLDERIFAYYDDLDLSWRAQLRGWRCRFEPDLVVTHDRAGRNAVRRRAGRSGGGLEQRLGVRNRLLVLLKCERWRDVLTALPFLLPYEIARLVYVTAAAPGALRGYLEAIRLAPSMLRSRRVLHARARPARLLAAPFFPYRARDAG